MLAAWLLIVACWALTVLCKAATCAASWLRLTLGDCASVGEAKKPASAMLATAVGTARKDLQKRRRDMVFPFCVERPTREAYPPSTRVHERRGAKGTVA